MNQFLQHFFCKNWFGIGPPHYVLSHSDFGFKGFEFAEIFVFEIDSPARWVGESTRDACNNRHTERSKDNFFPYRIIFACPSQHKSSPLHPSPPARQGRTSCWVGFLWLQRSATAPYKDDCPVPSLWWGGNGERKGGHDLCIGRKMIRNGSQGHYLLGSSWVFTLPCLSSIAIYCRA
jgi:hypothetical protein